MQIRFAVKTSAVLLPPAKTITARNVLPMGGVANRASPVFKKIQRESVF